MESSAGPYVVMVRDYFGGHGRADKRRHLYKISEDLDRDGTRQIYVFGKDSPPLAVGELAVVRRVEDNVITWEVVKDE